MNIDKDLNSDQIDADHSRTVQKTAEEWLVEGYVLSSYGLKEGAVVAYERAIRLNPQLASAHNDRRSALMNLERYEEALVAFEEAIRLNPNLTLAYHNKGSALFFLNRYEEALATFEEAIRVDPNFALAYHNKGLLLLSLSATKKL